MNCKHEDHTHYITALLIAPLAALHADETKPNVLLAAATFAPWYARTRTTLAS